MSSRCLLGSMMAMAMAMGMGIETMELTHTPTAPLAVQEQPPVGARYYWRVRACISDLCSAYSATSWINLGRDPRDFNGDGFSDVLVGAPFEGVSVAGAGDVDGDGFGDVVIGESSRGRTHLHFGGAVPGAAGGREPALLEGQSGFGGRVSAAGDLNRDGFSDLLVSGDGTAKVLFGNDKAFFDVALDGSIGGGLGDAAGAGDVDGDGIGDVLVGHAAEGFAAIYLGTEGARFDGDLSNRRRIDGSVAELFGSSVAAAGDVDGDGRADLIIGAPHSLGIGKAYLYRGANGGFVVGATLQGLAASWFGVSVASLNPPMQ